MSFVFLGCATPTPYQPANYLGKGFKEQKLGQDKYRVSFKGNSITERDTVESYLIYRSAELTLKEDYPYFTMMNMNTDRKTHYESTSPVVYGMYNQDQQRFPYYIYGHPTAYRGGTMENTEYEAVAFIVMVKKPEEDKKDSFYKAKEVIKFLTPKIIRPK